MARRTKKRVRDIRIEFVHGHDINADDEQIVIRPVRDFEVWVDGVHVARCDTSAKGLIEYARIMEKVL